MCVNVCVRTHVHCNRLDFHSCFLSFLFPSFQSAVSMVHRRNQQACLGFTVALSSKELCCTEGMAEFILFRGTESVMACVFPVRSSLAGFTFFQVDSWPVGNRGLRWDREWAVLSEKGSCLSQKQEPLMAAIVPAVDCCTGQLTLCRRKQERGGNDEGTVVVPAGGATYAVPSHHSLCQARVCGDRSVNGFWSFYLPVSTCSRLVSFQGSGMGLWTRGFYMAVLCPWSEMSSSQNGSGLQKRS